MGPDVTARLRAFGEPLANAPNRPQSVTLHTSLGDVKVEVYCEEVPRSAENFLALCASGYYDDTIFHRNIKGFMIQVSAAAPAPPTRSVALPRCADERALRRGRRGYALRHPVLGSVLYLTGGAAPLEGAEAAPGAAAGRGTGQRQTNSSAAGCPGRRDRRRALFPASNSIVFPRCSKNRVPLIRGPGRRCEGGL